MEETKKKRWNWTVVLCVVLLVMNLWQGGRLSELERDIWNAQNSVMDNISGMDRRLSSLYSELESADDLVQDWDYSTSMDMEKRRLKVDVTVNLKEWREDTAVQAVWTNLYGESLEGVGDLTGTRTGSFSGVLELPSLERLNEISLSAVIANGGVQRRESLGSLGDRAGLLPVQCNSWGTSGFTYRDGVFTFSGCMAELYSRTDKVPEGIKDAVFRLAKNGEVVAEETAMQGDTMGRYECDKEWSGECRPGDEVAVTFFCRDGSGLGYEFFLEGWTVLEDDLDRLAPETGWPKLAWN